MENEVPQTNEPMAQESEAVNQEQVVEAKTEEQTVEAPKEVPVEVVVDPVDPTITIETFGTRMCTCGMEITLEDQPVICSKCKVKHIK